MEERVIQQGAFKAIEKIPQLDLQKVVPSDIDPYKQGGSENLMCVVAVNSVGEVHVISTLNPDQAEWFYSDEGRDYIENDFDFGPGIYLVEFWIDGSRDYWGEYDSWSEFENIMQYKVKILDKRKHTYDEEIWPYRLHLQNKNYESEQTEYPRCLFIVNDDGTMFLLDVLNEDKAYTGVLREIVDYTEEFDKIEGIECLGLYEADFKIVGDMKNLLDRDDNEDVQLSNIRRIPLILEDKPMEFLSQKEKKIKKIDIFCKYVDELRAGEEHIK